jgi:hypothetical protein
VGPNQSRCGDGKTLKDTLGDEADLDMTVIGVEFSADSVTVGGGLVMEILVA